MWNDPDLAPTHHYLAVYRWVEREFGAHAVVHVGKHGNLEWLPGKALALSETCFPEVALGPVPHLYPFIVNDPGEGTQAKRRAHAVIVDHLLPPMTRAESYDDLARLEEIKNIRYRRVKNLSRLLNAQSKAFGGKLWRARRHRELVGDDELAMTKGQ